MMKMERSSGRSLVSGRKFLFAAGAALLLAAACGGDDDGDGGDGDGDGDGDTVTNTGGTTGDGDGDATGGTTGDGDGDGTGGTTVTNPTEHGDAVDTAIPAGDFAIAEDGFGTAADAGFEGYAYTYADEGYSSIFPVPGGAYDPGDAGVAEGKLCANGTAAQVVDNMWSEIWGAGVGWNLAQPADQETPGTVELDSEGITFTLVTETSAEIRFSLNTADATYCVTGLSAGENTIAWTDLNSMCWDGTGDDYDPAAEEAESIAWQVAATNSAASPFDFCVGGITFGGADGMGGAGGGTGD